MISHGKRRKHVSGAPEPEPCANVSQWSHKKFGDLAEEKRISTYVECQTDAEFRIRIVLKHPYRFDSPSLTFKASVDGHGIAQSTCSADYFSRSYNMYMEIMASKLERLSATEISSRPLKFTSITKGQLRLLSGCESVLVPIMITRSLRSGLSPIKGFLGHKAFRIA